MDENKNVQKLEEPVNFTYPDGFKEVAQMLTFLPEAAREQVLTGFISIVTSVVV